MKTREIKFRGKRTDNGEWVYGVPVKEESGMMIITSEVKWQDVSEFYIRDFDYVDPSTIGEYTGLKDIEGKEIFEGDIVMITEVDEDSALGREFEYKAEVVYSNGDKSKWIPEYPCSFCLLSDEFYHEQALLGNRRHRIEVAGTIHDQNKGEE